MGLRVQNIELQEYLEGEVRSGRFLSVDAAVEAAVARMMIEEQNLPPLDEGLEARLVEAEAQVARGEFYTVDQVRAMFASKVGSRS